MGSRRRVPAFPLVVLLLLGGCSDDTGRDEPASSPATVRADAMEYSNEVDGISLSWPEGWHATDGALDGARQTNSVELVALATFEGASAGQCAPAPDAAMAAMEENDVLLVLRTNQQGPPGPVSARPRELMTNAEPVSDSITRPGQARVEGCYPEGVEAWNLSFQEHGRPYDILVAARSPLSDERRGELEQIWSNLQLTPIAIGRDTAEIGRTYWHVLYTHCGVKDTTFDGREWVTDPELSDGGGNPPRGWNNPEQPGTMTMRGENSAVFESRGGERSARFRPRTTKDPPPTPCA